MRRHPQGTAEGAEGRCPCADADGDADPAHAADGDVGPARTVGHPDPADRSVGGPHLCDALGRRGDPRVAAARAFPGRSEEHTSELQSLMRISYAVFCLNKNNSLTCTATPTDT